MGLCFGSHTTPLTVGFEPESISGVIESTPESKIWRARVKFSAKASKSFLPYIYRIRQNEVSIFKVSLFHNIIRYKSE